jgi:KipI family sensor histidine kinase inhibitor
MADLSKQIYEAASHQDTLKEPNDKIVEIPILYGGEYGPDLSFVADCAKLSENEIISIHSETLYRVYMIGFTPGFPYLGILDSKLHISRRETPRNSIPAGSVAIAEGQTGIYPVESPGGWHIIGKTPVALFDFNLNPPTLVSIGDSVKFVPIDNESDFTKLEKDIKNHG